jgi:hypothetical protein
MSLIDHPLIVSKLEAIPKILSKEYLDPQSMSDSEKRAIFTKALPPLLITGYALDSIEKNVKKNNMREKFVKNPNIEVMQNI